jgi:hypothetical protein
MISTRAAHLHPAAEEPVSQHAQQRPRIPAQIADLAMCLHLRPAYATSTTTAARHLGERRGEVSQQVGGQAEGRREGVEVVIAEDSPATGEGRPIECPGLLVLTQHQQVGGQAFAVCAAATPATADDLWPPTPHATTLPEPWSSVHTHWCELVSAGPRREYGWSTTKKGLLAISEQLCGSGLS